jgi:PhnB protein
MAKSASSPRLLAVLSETYKTRQRPGLSLTTLPSGVRAMSGSTHESRAPMYVPPGFATVLPYFFVAEAERFVAFLIDGLGGTEVLRSKRTDGRIANCQVRLGTATVMASEAGGAYPPMQMACYLYVEDAHSALEKALAAGASLEMAVADMPYGDRQGGVRDPHGNIWWLSQRLVHRPYSA